MSQPPTPFTGIGTVLLADITTISRIAERMGPEGLIESLNRHLDHVVSVVEKHSGVILQYVGDAVLAFWHPSHTAPNHAQLAFDAAREILESLPRLMAKHHSIAYDMEVILGTGPMAGDFFGPMKQYQIVGAAMATATRLSDIRYRRGSSVRMSQYTVELIRPTDGLQEIGMIPREGLDDLRIITYSPVASDGRIDSRDVRG